MVNNFNPTAMLANEAITLVAQLTQKTTVKQAPVACRIIWTVDDPSLVTLRPSQHGEECRATGTGLAGVANVMCTVYGQTVLTYVTQITITSQLADTLVVKASQPYVP